MSICLLLSLHCDARHPARLIYQYPNIGSWFENAAVRCNGDILLTSLNSPGGIHSLNPSNSLEPALITNDFDFLNSTLGIVETERDIFWVIASNFSLDLATLGTQPGTNAIFKVMFHDHGNETASEPSVSLLSYLSDAEFLNGLTKYNNTFLLAADSGLGAVWGVNTITGEGMIVAKDRLMRPQRVDGYAEGINGLHLYGNNLYFSNSQRHLFGYVELEGNGYQKGDGVLVATPFIEQGVNANWDDFAVDEAGQFAYIATEIGQTIQRIDLNNGEVMVFAGGLNSTTIAQPTSVVFGRTVSDAEALYAVTAGGFAYPVYTSDGPKQFGAQVVAIDVIN